MKLLKAFLMSFSMFCAIPCPIHFWDVTLKHYVTAMLPVVGLVLGVLWVFIAELCAFFSLPLFLTGAILTVTPWWLSGCIHLDGFMDCCDAILSRRDLTERQRILKDPLTGSFAVIAMVTLALFIFAAHCDANLASYSYLLFVPVITRSLSSLSVQILKPISTSQYTQCTHTAGSLFIPILMLTLAFALSFAMNITALWCGLGALVGWCIACWRGYKCLNGMSGDISGHAITIGEACGVITFACLL